MIKELFKRLTKKPYDKLEYVAPTGEQYNLLKTKYETCKSSADMANIFDLILACVQEETKLYQSDDLSLSFKDEKPRFQNQPYIWAIKMGEKDTYTTLHLGQFPYKGRYDVKICNNKTQEEIQTYIKSFKENPHRDDFRTNYENGAIVLNDISKADTFKAVDQALGYVLSPAQKLHLSLERQSLNNPASPPALPLGSELDDDGDGFVPDELPLE